MAKRLKAKKWRRCKVEASVVSVELEYSKSLGPGQLVDLSEPVNDEVVLGDLVSADWFEDGDQAERGVHRKSEDTHDD